jgi:hypothetical protein
MNFIYAKLLTGPGYKTPAELFAQFGGVALAD